MDTLQKSIDVNMHAVIEITKLTIPLIKHSESGRIINMCSTYSLVAPNWQLYSEGNKKFKSYSYVLSKAFLPIFTKALAVELSDFKITVNGVAPHGVVENSSSQENNVWKRLSPIGRFSTVDEAIYPILFLASEKASYITGQILSADGGWTAW